MVEEVLKTALAWGDVNVKPAGGNSEGNSLRLYRRGSPFGAFAYVMPAYAQLRLTADAAEGMKYATVRNVQPSTPHQVNVPLNDRSALDEVRALVRWPTIGLSPRSTGSGSVAPAPVAMDARLRQRLSSELQGGLRAERVQPA